MNPPPYPHSEDLGIFTQFDTIFSIIQIVLSVVLIIFIIKSLIETRNKNMYYILTSISILCLGSLLSIVMTSILSEYRMNFLYSTQSYISMLSSSFFLILFIDSFKYKDIFTKKNIISEIFVITEIVVVITYITSILIIYPTEIFQDSTEISTEMIESFFSAVAGFKYLSIALLITNLTLLAHLSLSTLRKIKHTTISSLKKLNIYIASGIGLQIINNGLSFYQALDPMGESVRTVTTISHAILLISYIVITFSLLRGGLTIFQDESLRKMVILDSNGLVYYEYDFRAYDSDGNESDKMFLISGALSAISKIFGELTGNSRSFMKELNFEDMNLTIESIEEFGLSLILITDKSSQFFQEGAKNIAIQIPKAISKFEENMVFTGEKKLRINKIVEEHFLIRPEKQVKSN